MECGSDVNAPLDMHADVPGQDLDEAVKTAKRNWSSGGGDAGVGQGDGSSQKRGKKNKKRKRGGKMNITRFVMDTCKHLREKKPALVWAAVDKLGVDVFQGLIDEVDVIESCGGQMTTDKGRRRTPGGVLWNILRARVHPDVYKHIMSEGRAAVKEKLMQPNARRRGVGNSHSQADGRSPDLTMDGRLGVQVKGQHRKIKAYKPIFHASSGDEIARVDNASANLDSIAAPQHVQNAWIEGVKSRVAVVEMVDAARVQPKAGSGETEGLPRKKVPLSERLRFPVQYDDLVEDGEIREPVDVLDPDEEIEEQDV